jgi:ribonuclease HII
MIKNMNHRLICGVDEAGRGPIAGPVTAAAVILPGDFPVHLLNDSKKLSPEKRETISILIRHLAMDWATGWAWPGEIDRVNIHHATLLAMARAVRGLTLEPHLIYVDGKFVPKVKGECKAVVKGDTKIHEIMAASIIAKTARDIWMIQYSHQKPEYEFHLHKGYPTKKHRLLVKKYGISPIHRKSFTITFPG